jgi:outer membrane protein assembly factor BamB
LKRADCSLNYKVEVAKNRQIIGMDSSDGLIFIASGAGFARSRGQARDTSSLLTVVEKLSGKKIWEKKFTTMMLTAPLVSNGKVYIANGMLDTNFTKTVGGHLFCLNGSDGTVVFDTEVEEYAFGMGNTILTLDDNIAVLLGMKFDRTSQVINPPQLFAFNADKGTQLWTEAPTNENRSFGIPAIQDGYLYVMENPGFQFGGGGGGPPGGGGGWTTSRWGETSRRRTRREFY